MANFFDNAGFFWWTGVVEDRQDPLQLGRCKVRIVGYHDSDKNNLPTDDLPWATMVQPITSAAMTGIGTTPLGPVEGTWVLGFFADGKDNQEPMVLGTLGGIPQSDYYNNLPSSQGFQDPSNTYPIKELLDEPDTNRLARGIRETFVDDKDAKRSTGIMLSRGQGTWDEPKSAFSALYPYNHVLSTESGHVQEFDDTPGKERIHTFHAIGTFTEIDKNGTRTTRIVGDDYEVLERNGYLYVKGKMNVTIDGTSNIYVKNNCNLQVDGTLSTDVHKDYMLNVAGDVKMSVGGDILMKSGGAIKAQGTSLDVKVETALHAEAGTTAELKSGVGFYIETATDFAVKAAKIALAGVLQQLNLTISPAATATAAALKPAVGTASTPNVPSPVSKLSPTEPSFPDVSFTLTSQQVKKFKEELVRAESAAADPAMSPEGKETAKEYVSLKSEELSSNAVASATVEPESDATKKTPANYVCPVGLKVVEIAKKDLGIIETSTPPGRNYGGKPGGGMLPEGVFGRIDEMVATAGLDNKSEVRRKGEGYYWCASAVTAWWKAAGLPIPSGSGSCRNWEAWGRKNGYFSTTPKVGAAILYGSPGAAHHIGIVAAVDSSGKVTTIEGNTSGGGFSRNGCGVFYKTPRSYIGFILPPPCA